MLWFISCGKSARKFWKITGQLTSLQVVPWLYLEKSHGMAWWTHILFFSGHTLWKGEGPTKSKSLFAVFKLVLQEYIKERFVDFLYLFLSIFTYLYLGLTILTFFFESYIPRSFSITVETLSEPYLGALGIYVVVKEIEHRRGRHIAYRWGDLFAALWMIFLIIATILTYVSEHYHVSIIYKTIVTNALAALIIRIGTILR